MNVLSSMLSFIAEKIGSTTMGTTATTLTGAIAEHESDISTLNTNNTNTTLSVSYTENDYCIEADTARLVAYRRSGMLFLNGNLNIRTAVPTGTSDTTIATISNWTANSYVYLTIPARNGSGILSAFITSAGLLKISNSSGNSVNGWCRFFACVPASD